jgi:hypothetical protein
MDAEDYKDLESVGVPKILVCIYYTSRSLSLSGYASQITDAYTISRSRTSVRWG